MSKECSVGRCEDRGRAADLTGPPAARRRAWCYGLVSMLCATEVPAHIGLPLYAYEIPDTAAIDLFDGSLSDWRTFAPGPSISSSAFQAYSTEAGPLGSFDFSDLAVEVWLAWVDEPPRVYVGISRWDDLHVRAGAPQEGEWVRAWCRDGVEFMIDGDHSGGQYSRFQDPSDDHRQARQAQGYNVMLDSLGVLHLGMWVDGGEGIWIDPRFWGTTAPFSAGGGALEPDGSSVWEFYVTPFDTLRQSAATSRGSRLEPGKVMGLGMTATDTDRECEHAWADTAWFLPSSNLAMERYADYFVDLHLLPGMATPIRAKSWGALKASIRRDNQATGERPTMDRAGGGDP